jgi:hypothetical protein
MGDSVLERNICFVDTSDSVRLEKIIHYAEQQLMSTLNSVGQLTSEFSGLLSGRGSSQVDVILYLISKGWCRLKACTVVTDLISFRSRLR